jgi:F0F1-type ATP synthase assembly protein I
MQAASRRTLDPAGAGGVLLLGIFVCAGIGALIGWAAGDIGIGVLVGTIVGIPVGIFAVYRRYREVFS